MALAVEVMVTGRVVRISSDSEQRTSFLSGVAVPGDACAFGLLVGVPKCLLAVDGVDCSAPELALVLGTALGVASSGTCTLQLAKGSKPIIGFWGDVGGGCGFGINDIESW